MRLFISRNIEVFGLFIILVSVFYLHWGELNDYPIGIHAWSQSDRYALSLGFIDNGFDFFRPQTLVYNKQFPGDFLEPYATTITSVDFPIHEYLIALLMKGIGTSSPWVFRLYTMSYSLVELFYLYLFAKEEIGSKLKAGFLISIVLLSPVYFHYQASFVPAIISLANVMIAYRAYFLYVKNRERFSLLLITVFFLLLATLARTPFALFLIAVFAQELLNDFLNKKTRWKKWAVFLVAFSIVGLYYLFNVSLRKTYGSIFLGTIVPAESFEELSRVISKVFNNWGWHYFTFYHLMTFVSLVILSLLTKKIFEFNFRNPLFIQVVIVGFGCVCYSFLMIKQFVDHDYYFLDTFFLVVVLGFVLVFKKSDFSFGLNKFLWIALCIVLWGGMLLQSRSIKNQRCVVDGLDRVRITINNFKGANVLLESLGVLKEAKILVIDSYIPNAPLSLMQRKGYVVMSTTYENIRNALDWKYDYIVVQNVFFESDIISVFPDFGSKVESIGGNGKISLLKKR